MSLRMLKPIFLNNSVFLHKDTVFFCICDLIFIKILKRLN